MRDRVYTILKNTYPKIEQEGTRVWKEAFGVLSPTIEEREGLDAIDFEDDYKQELAKLTIEIEELVSGYEKKDIVTIKDDTNTPLPNPNIPNEEKIQILMKDSRKVFTNPILL